MNRKVGKLKKSMVEAEAVKHMASDAKSRPPKKAHNRNEKGPRAWNQTEGSDHCQYYCSVYGCPGCAP